MVVSYMDFSKDDVQYKANLKDHELARKNDENVMYEMGIEQLNSIGDVSLLDIYLSDGNLIEAHYHQNASEVIYCITGSTRVSMINPDTEELITITIEPAEVVSIPQGWWHYVWATEDDTHLLASFDTPIIQTIFGSQILRIMPKEDLSYMYCLDEETVETALDPIDETYTIAPPSDCTQENENDDNDDNAEAMGKKEKRNHANITGKQSSKKKDKQAWRPYVPPFPGAFHPKQ